jgi:lipoate---protein ligase
MSDLSLMPLTTVSPLDEQAWNQRQLATPVSRPCAQIWRYQTPAIVLGCAQRGSVSAEQARRRAGIELAEREAGGGAVLVGPWMVSSSIVLPVDHPYVSAGPVRTYRWLGELYASLLQAMGITAHAVKPDEVSGFQPQHVHVNLDWACYGGISPWEVLVNGKKIVGLAQVRRRTGVLLVAGLLVDRPDWPLLCRAMDRSGNAADVLANRTTSCSEELGRPVLADEVAGVVDGLLQSALQP